MSAEAVKRFLDSMIMDFDMWHDGTGYDLSAIDDMTADERKSLVISLKAQTQTWRELEALAALDMEEVDVLVQETATTSESTNNRITAAAALHDRGKMKPEEFEELLCKEIRKLDGRNDGYIKVLLEAEANPSEKVKQALLWSSWNSTEASMSCAARLLYLCGKAEDQLAWSHREWLFDIQPNNSYFTRKKAFDKLCALCEMTLDESQWTG
jgi:hypothetical protein